MRLKNRIALILCAVVVTVSFLHPFSGRTVCAEETAVEVPEEQTAEEDTAGTEDGKERPPEETSTCEDEEPEKAAQGMETEAAGEGGASGAETETKEEGTGIEDKKEESKPEAETEKTGEEEETEPAEAETEETPTAETEPDEMETAAAETEEDTGTGAVEETGPAADGIKMPVIRQVSMMRAAGARSSIGIDPAHPQDGQQNRYEYGGAEETWTVPAAGEYEIYCYGAGGGSGRGWAFQYTGSAGSSDGLAGALRACRVYLTKGMVLRIHAGGAGGSVGNISYNNKICGAAGWNDGVKGVYASTGGDDDNKNGSLGTGGGGGSSYVICNGVKIISAAGGSGGGAWYQSPNGNASRDGGAGGGVTALNNASGVEWDTAKFNRNEGAANNGNGYVLVRAVAVTPDISLTAAGEWTNEDIVITAHTMEREEDLPEECFSWETDGEGNPVWTGSSTYTASANGTYKCRIRDTGGKVGEASIEITCIDKLRPVVEIKQSGEAWTTENVTLTAVVEDVQADGISGCSGVPQECFSWQTGEDGDCVWTDGQSYTVDDNGVYVCRGRDKAGNITEAEVQVSRIDRTPPEVYYERPSGWYEGGAKIKIWAKDLQPDGTEGCGLDETPFSMDGVHFVSLAELEVEKEGVYSIWVRDRLGNSREAEFTLKYDKKETTSADKKEKDKDKDRDSGGKGGTAAPVPAALPVTEPQNAEEASDEGGISLQTYAEYVGETADTAYAGEEQTEAEVSALAVLPALEMEPEIRQKKLPPMQEKGEEAKAERISSETTGKKTYHWKKAVLYSVWMAVIFCGLLWLLFGLVFEHVTVYRKDESGKYRKAGRCAIIRKKDYKQIDLLRLMEKEKERDYKVCFARMFVLLHKNEKVLLRTYHGVELRNVAKEIEILACNS